MMQWLEDMQSISQLLVSNKSNALITNWPGKFHLGFPFYAPDISFWESLSALEMKTN